MNEITYETTNGFHLGNKSVLFFNIFIKNNKLYLITPINIKHSTITITYNSNKLICVENIKKAMNEPTQIIIYDFNFDSEDVYEINVLFKDKKKNLC